MKKNVMKKVLRVAELIHRNPLFVIMLLFGDRAKEVFSYIRGITSLEDAYKAYDNAPDDNDKVKNFAKKKCAALALQKLSRARTLKQFESIGDLCPHGCKAKNLARYQIALLEIKHDIKHAETIKKIKDAYYDTNAYARLGNQVGGKFKKLAFRKWGKLALRQVRRAETLEEIKAAYDVCPDKSKSQKIAFQKYDRLALKRAKYAETISEVKAAYDASPEGGRAQKFSFTKWDTMALRRVKESKTLEEINKNILILRLVPNEGRARRLVLQKLDKLTLQTVKQAENIEEIANIHHGLLVVRGRAEKAAIQKMYDLA